MTSDKKKELGPLQDPRSARSIDDSWSRHARAARLPPGVELDDRPNWLGEYPPLDPRLVALVKESSPHDWDLPPDIKNKPHYDKRPKTAEETTESVPMDVDNPNNSNNSNTTVSSSTAMSQDGYNPFQGIPLLPTSLFGSPKLALQNLYARSPSGLALPNTAYFTWDAPGCRHDYKWTSIFMCPLTFELFASGRYDDPSTYNVNDGTIWYTQKRLAEHAAAARVFSCLYYRLGAPQRPVLGDDMPYLKGDHPPLPVIPPQIKEAMDAFRKLRIDAAAEKQRKVQEQAQAMEEEALLEQEAIMERESYRELRLN